MAKKTIGVLALLDLLKALRRLGADAELLCRRARLAPTALRDLGGRVHWSAVEVILAQAERTLRDPLIGLHAGEKARPRGPERIEDLAIALERRALPSSVRSRVSGTVRAMLIAGARPDRSRVARQLGMSDRTLQRALAREGVTFKTVRDDVVWDGVPALLANPACSVEEAAASTGFADAAGFSRAFSRRMGCSPSRYRERLVGT